MQEKSSKPVLEKRKDKNHKVKIRIKDEAKITNQKGRKIRIQMRNAVDKEI